MKITRIIGIDGTMPQQCSGGCCPSLIETNSPDIVIQGYTLSKEERSALSNPEGEDFIKMPVATLQKLMANMNQ